MILLPKGLVVVEILEDVQADDDVVVQACQKLKDAGFILALDDLYIMIIKDRLLILLIL